MKRITIKDIAKELGLSVSTISRALNGSSQISEKVKAEVQEFAKANNYKANLKAKSLRLKKTQSIALILPEINAFFSPELIYGVNAAATNEAYSVIIFQTENQFEKEVQLLDYALNLDVDGILLSVSEETVQTDHIKKIMDIGIPVLLIDKLSESPYLHGLSINGYEAAFKATQFLINKGHKKIIGIFGNSALMMTKQRQKGFEHALLSFDSKEIIGRSFQIDQILQLQREIDPILEECNDFTAIFSMSDELMVYLHHELMRRNINIPQEISLISISDGFAPYYLYPNITHIHHSGFEVGYKAFQMLLEGIKTTNKGKNWEPFTEMLKTKLCELDSVKQV